MANLYILRAELTDAMNRLRDCRKRCMNLEDQLAKMELEIIKLKDEKNGQQTSQAHASRTSGNQRPAP